MHEKIEIHCQNFCVPGNVQRFQNTFYSSENRSSSRCSSLSLGCQSHLHFLRKPYAQKHRATYLLSSSIFLTTQWCSLGTCNDFHVISQVMILGLRKVYKKFAQIHMDSHRWQNEHKPMSTSLGIGPRCGTGYYGLNVFPKIRMLKSYPHTYTHVTVLETKSLRRRLRLNKIISVEP